MSIDYNQLAIPKGKTRKQLKARKDREDAKQLKAFQDEVWRRERHLTFPDSEPETTGARCQNCGRFVYRSFEPFGEVHHRISRRHKATRYDPANGVLLCHNCHVEVTEKRITV